MMATSLAIPPSGTGECIMTWHHDADTGQRSVTIDRADPVILISRYVLEDIVAHEAPHWCAQVTLAEVVPVDDIYLGAVLRIAGSNQTAVYRITERQDEDTYIGQWPD